MEADVSFDAIARSWNSAVTGLPAEECFDGAIDALAAEGIPLCRSDLAFIAAAMWATLDHLGKAPGPEDAPRLAEALGRHWPLVASTLSDGARTLRREGVAVAKMTRGSLTVVFVWRLMWRQWAERSALTEEAARSALAALDPAFAALSHAVGEGEEAAWPSHPLARLAEDWNALKRTTDPAEAVRVLVARCAGSQHAGELLSP